MPRPRAAAAAGPRASATSRADPDIVRRRESGSNAFVTSKTTMMTEFEIYKRAAAAGIAPPLVHAEDDAAGNGTARFAMANGGSTLKEVMNPKGKSAKYWPAGRARRSLIKAVMHRVWALHDLGICHGDLHGKNILLRYVYNDDVPEADKVSKSPAFAYDSASRYFAVSLIDFGSARAGATEAELANDRIEVLDYLLKLLPCGSAGNREALKLVHMPPTDLFPWNIAASIRPKKSAAAARPRRRRPATKTKKAADMQPPPPRPKKDDDDDDEVLCAACNKDDRDAPMLVCDACSRSFHYETCVAAADKADLAEPDMWFCARCEAFRLGIESLRTQIAAQYEEMGVDVGSKTVGFSRQAAQKGPWRGDIACKYPREAGKSMRALKNITARSVKTIVSTSSTASTDDDEAPTYDPLTPEECEFYAALCEFEDHPLADAADYVAKLPMPVVEVYSTTKKRAAPEEQAVAHEEPEPEAAEEPPKKRARVRKAAPVRVCSLCEQEIPGGTFAIERNRDGFVLPVDNVRHARSSSDVYHKRCFYPKPVVVEIDSGSETETETEDEASVVYDDDAGFIHRDPEAVVIEDVDDDDTNANSYGYGYPQSPPPHQHEDGASVVVSPLFPADDDDDTECFGTVRAVTMRGKDLGTYRVVGAGNHVIGSGELADFRLHGATSRVQCTIRVLHEAGEDPAKARLSLHNAGVSLGTSVRFWREDHFDPMSYHDSELGFRPGATGLRHGDIFAFGTPQHGIVCKFESAFV